VAGDFGGTQTARGADGARAASWTMSARRGVPQLLAMNIRTLREDTGLTQVQLAEMARLSQESIGGVETGSKTNPSAAALVRQAQALKVTVGK
jgi:DNA-binding XRE family transcriptional regulator